MSNGERPKDKPKPSLNRTVSILKSPQYFKWKGECVDLSLNQRKVEPPSMKKRKRPRG